MGIRVWLSDVCYISQGNKIEEDLYIRRDGYGIL